MVEKLTKEQQRLQDVIDSSWLNLGDTSKIHTPERFSKRTKEDIEDPYRHVLRYMMNPDYFYFTVKSIFNIELLPFQLTILKELWHRKYPMLIGSRGASKSFMLALYAMLRALLDQGSKVIIVGAAFRQSKVVFEYCESIWNNAPVLRSLFSQDNKSGPRRDIDRCTMRLGDSLVIALPLGDGSKIRGQRANYIIADEFASIPVDIYENVVSGFAAVSSSPVEMVKHKARLKALQELGLTSQDIGDDGVLGNQAIISGTAYYGFNHFCDYWRRYKEIIHSRGDKKKLNEIFKGEVPENFNYKDYCVIRMPYELLPEGFMDEKHVARSRVTVHSGIYQMEFGACFATDSNGFFKRSLVESCVTKEPIQTLSGESVSYHAMIRGNSKKRYVFGVDPASEHDNFSIVVIELNDGYRKVVYCWTTTRQQHKEKLIAGLVSQQDFYGYCARKIRDLMKSFPCEAIALDSQGGGIAIEEALHDGDKLLPGERPIWPIIEDDNGKDTDNYIGEHILHIISFSDAEWVKQANHGMRKDFEDKTLLFPFFDSLSIGFAIEEDKSSKRIYDTLEDCVLEIEELKDELATIVHTQTGVSGRDRWDTPEVKLPGGKKGRMRKDRYSALLMANAVGRDMQRIMPITQFVSYGGFAKDMQGKTVGNGQLYQGPAWFVSGTNSMQTYGMSVKRGV